VSRCCEKFLSTSARVGQRFQELFGEMERAAAQAQEAQRRQEAAAARKRGG
jgi:hypothetical protein